MVDEQKLRKLAELLLLQSSEIAAAQHNGWGNTMADAAAAILSLLDELQTLREERTAWRVTAENAEALVTDLRKQNEAQKDEWLSWAAKRDGLEKDAERYQWLRKTTNFVTSKGERIDVSGQPELWDASIDAAILEANGDSHE